MRRITNGHAAMVPLLSFAPTRISEAGTAVCAPLEASRLVNVLGQPERSTVRRLKHGRRKLALLSRDEAALLAGEMRERPAARIRPTKNGQESEKNACGYRLRDPVSGQFRALGVDTKLPNLRLPARFASPHGVVTQNRSRGRRHFGSHLSAQSAEQRTR